MASSKVHQSYICHFCFDEFIDRSSLISHFSHCPTPTPLSLVYDENIRLPRLTKTELQLLHLLKLHRFTTRDLRHKPTGTRRLQSNVPVSACQALPFDDSLCTTDNLQATVNGRSKDGVPWNILNTKLSSCHTYKYSRRERKHFYASVQRARLKKQYISTRKSRLTSTRLEQTTFFIHLPTIITSRQRLNGNFNNSYPLLFDPNFHSLVTLSTENLFRTYFSPMNTYFHLIHSIASQEFQTIVHSHDHHQAALPFTAFSCLHLFRQTMFNYSMTLQKSSKRDYFQAFHHDQQSRVSCKSRRSDSSHPQTTGDRLFSQLTIDPPVRSEASPVTVTESLQASVPRIDHPPALMNTQVVVSELQIVSDKTKLQPKIESTLYNQSNGVKDKARIRSVNWITDADRKQPTTRQATIKKVSISNDHTLRKLSTRLQMRRNSVTDEKHSNLPEMPPPFEAKPVALPFSTISKQWSTNTVFYRCHACSHEEFFLVLSRECMNLHLSSKHGNMQENFKQRLSNYVNNQGRSMKIFQHYLKWQQSWSDKEMEQIFQLSNSHTQTTSRR